MYRIGFILVMVLASALGMIVGALNPQIVTVDLLWFSLAWPLGLTLICMLLAGVTLGLILLGLFRLWPLKLQLRQARKELASKSPVSSALVDATDV